MRLAMMCDFTTGQDAMNFEDIEKAAWSEWEEAPSVPMAIIRGQRVWPEAVIGQGPDDPTVAWFPIDAGAQVRVIETKSEDGRFWFRTRQRTG
jgi:hypothetical protein